jgi:hypothetical protein
LFVDASGNVGAGISSPTAKLDVIATSGTLFRAEYAGIAQLNIGNGGNSINYYDGDTQIFRNGGGSERMRLDSSGRLGLGTSSPGSRLTVNRVNFADASATGSTTLSNAGITVEATTDTNSRLMFGIGSTGSSPWIQAQNTLSNATQSLILNPVGGNVGIGTTSPGQKVEVAGVVLSKAGGNAARYDATDTDSGGATITLNAALTGPGAPALQTQTNHPILFAPNNTERARIDSSGRLLVGTSSGSDERCRIEQEAGANWIAAFRHTTTGSEPLGIRIHYAGSSINNTGQPFLYCHDTSVLRAEFRSNGGLANFSANNANLSDRNAKKDISLAADTWSCVKEWEIVNYRYKDQSDDADLNLGVIAQQVAESCPEVITVFQEAKEATEDQPAQEERLGVKEQQMIWMAIKALQEAQLRIETLEAKVAALEGV